MSTGILVGNITFLSSQVLEPNWTVLWWKPWQITFLRCFVCWNVCLQSSDALDSTIKKTVSAALLMNIFVSSSCAKQHTSKTFITWITLWAMPGKILKKIGANNSYLHWVMIQPCRSNIKEEISIKAKHMLQQTHNLSLLSPHNVVWISGCCTIVIRPYLLVYSLWKQGKSFVFVLQRLSRYAMNF